MTYDEPYYGPPPQYPTQPYGQPEWGYASAYSQPAPGKPRRTRLLFTSSAAVVVLAAGGVATYAAVSDSDAGGAGSPKAAVQAAITDLDNSDLVGLLDDLAPGERRALATPVRDTISQLKRTGVLSQNADPSNISGVQIRTSGLTYAPTTITVNDHVQIVQITGGTLTVHGDLAKLPLSQDFLKVVAPQGLHGSETRSVNIAQQLSRAHRPALRIATQKVGGSWYPSVFYTAADNATYRRGLPTAADDIPATGAASPGDAVTALLQDAISGDYVSVIGVLSPDELGVLHEYGRLIVRRSQGGSPGGGLPFGLGSIKLSNLAYDTKSQSDGTVLVQVARATISFGGRTVTTRRDGDCYSVTSAGQTRRVCLGTNAANSISALISRFTGRPLTARQVNALSDVFSSFRDLGVVASERDGRWFVNPVRTIADVVPTVLAHLKSGDLLALAGLVRR